MKAKKPKFRGKNVSLPLAMVQLTRELQGREGGEDAEHIDDLHEAIKGRTTLPRVKIVFVEKGPKTGHFAVDGLHTVRAYDKAGRKTVPCTVRYGTWEDAVVEAAGANTEHLGLKRSSADKQRAARMLLENLGSEWTDGRIADHVGVSRESVRLWRAKYKPDTSKPEPSVDRPATTRTGANDRQYKIKARPVKEWKDTPVGDLALKGLQTHVWAELADRGVRTAGDLWGRLHGYVAAERALRLANPILENLRKQLAASRELWEEGSGEAAAVPASARSPSPTAEFDWKGASAAWGPMARLADTIANHYPDFKRSPEYAALGRLASDALGLVKDIQKRLTGAKK